MLRRSFLKICGLVGATWSVQPLQQKDVVLGFTCDSRGVTAIFEGGRSVSFPVHAALPHLRALVAITGSRQSDRDIRISLGIQA